MVKDLILLRMIPFSLKYLAKELLVCEPIGLTYQKVILLFMIYIILLNNNKLNYIKN